ncbi:MAG: zinc ribbon domain-containing protein [Christensenellaceae bacterium]|jgi:hypothetical protein|nr:zinc ribbon domain-containing protein [Christensenellaceae bacterium]
MLLATFFLTACGTDKSYSTSSWSSSEEYIYDQISVTSYLDTALGFQISILDIKIGIGKAVIEYDARRLFREYSDDCKIMLYKLTAPTATTTIADITLEYLYTLNTTKQEEEITQSGDYILKFFDNSYSLVAEEAFTIEPAELEDYFEITTTGSELTVQYFPGLYSFLGGTCAIELRPTNPESSSFHVEPIQSDDRGGGFTIGGAVSNCNFSIIANHGSRNAAIVYDIPLFGGNSKTGGNVGGNTIDPNALYQIIIAAVIILLNILFMILSLRAWRKKVKTLLYTVPRTTEQMQLFLESKSYAKFDKRTKKYKAYMLSLLVVSMGLSAVGIILGLLFVPMGLTILTVISGMICSWFIFATFVSGSKKFVIDRGECLICGGNADITDVKFLRTDKQTREVARDAALKKVLGNNERIVSTTQRYEKPKYGNLPAKLVVYDLIETINEMYEVSYKCNQCGEIWKAEEARNDRPPEITSAGENNEAKTKSEETKPIEIIDNSKYVFCVECGKKNKLTNSKCDSCGNALIKPISIKTIFCAYCGAKNNFDKEVCEECHKELLKK